jgi:hypothetical protein
MYHFAYLIEKACLILILPPIGINILALVLLGIYEVIIILPILAIVSLSCYYYRKKYIGELFFFQYYDKQIFKLDYISWGQFIYSNKFEYGYEDDFYFSFKTRPLTKRELISRI